MMRAMIRVDIEGLRTAEMIISRIRGGKASQESTIALDQEIDYAAQVAGDQPEDRRQRHTGEHRDKGDAQLVGRRADDAAKNVTAERVRPERMRPASATA